MGKFAENLNLNLGKRLLPPLARADLRICCPHFLIPDLGIHLSPEVNQSIAVSKIEKSSRINKVCL